MYMYKFGWIDNKDTITHISKDWIWRGASDEIPVWSEIQLVGQQEIT